MSMSQGTEQQLVYAKPFLKWAGGKSQLLPQVAACYPTGLEDGTLTYYVEPFVGGGAVFFDVAQRFPIERALLTDINKELILTYRVVREFPAELIDALGDYQDRYDQRDRSERANLFYAIREQYNENAAKVNYDDPSLAWVARAAQLIFLNKTCFNGLYRVNSRGLFNVPHGRYKNPRILDEPNIRRASEVLQIAEIRVGSYEEVVASVDAATFVYFDPPYRPLNATSSFTSYARSGFNDDDQRRLAALFARLDRTTGARLMLSNSDPHNSDPDDDFFDDLYADFTIHRLSATRMINSKASGRGRISEILVTNF